MTGLNYHLHMKMISCLYLSGIVFFASSCHSQKGDVNDKKLMSTTIKLDDSSRKFLINALTAIVDSNASADDVSIDAAFVSQGKLDDNNDYLILKKNDSIIKLINPMPLREEDIHKLKKEGDNISLTYRASTRKISLLFEKFEEGAEH